LTAYVVIMKFYIYSFFYVNLIKKYAACATVCSWLVFCVTLVSQHEVVW
jgi:hypothetical protein